MSEGKSAATPQPVTHEQARQAVRKMHEALYNGKPVPSLHVPPHREDVDMVLSNYIIQQQAGSVAAPKAGEPPQELIERARAAWKVVIHPALMPAATALSYEECRAADEVIVREMANFAESELRGAGETPAERWIPELRVLLTKARRGLNERTYANEAACALWTDGADSDGCGYCLHCIRGDIEDAAKLLPLPPGAGSTKEGK